MKTKSSVVVMGGGLSGLTSAYELVRSEIATFSVGNKFVYGRLLLPLANDPLLVSG